MKKLKNIPYHNWIILIILAIGLVMVLKINILDSDSGRELQRATLLTLGDQNDGGPLISQGIYSALFLISRDHFSYIIKLLNIILLAVILIFSVRTLENFDVKESGKFTFVFLFFSVLPLYLLVFYLKPYLLVTFYFVMILFYMSCYLKTSNYTHLFLACLFISISILTKNHAYPFIVIPFVVLAIEFFNEKRIKLKPIIICLTPLVLLLGPYILLNSASYGLKFWHYPNTWYFKEGLSPYMATNFWGYPEPLSAEYFLGQIRFLVLSVPLVSLVPLCLIFLFKHGKRFLMLFLPLLILSIIPFAFGVMPFYQQYNYLPSLITIFFISTSTKYLAHNKYTKILLFSMIFIFAAILLSSNASHVAELNENSIGTINEFEIFKVQHGQGFILARDFKLQQFTNKNLNFVSVDNLNGEDIVKIFANESSQEDLHDSLVKNKIGYMLFYKDERYNEIYHKELMRFFDKKFSTDRFSQSPYLDNIFDGDYIIIFEFQNETPN